MDSATIDHVHREWIIPLVCARVDASGAPGPKDADRFWIVMAQAGSGIARAGETQMVFSSPAVFCLNETEDFRIVESRSLELRILSFHPRFVNSSFDFSNIRDGSLLPVSCTQDLFWFAPFVERGASSSQGRGGCLELGPVTARRFALIMDEIAGQLERQPDGWPCRSRSYFIELLFLLQRVFADSGTGDVPRPADGGGIANKAILYLHENLSRGVTIAEMASALGTNRTTLMNEFREATGTSIKDYLIGLRIRFAASLIRDTTLSLSEITERSGFNDLPHFSRTFRERMGCSPSDYRQQNCWMLSLYPDFRD
jgi:AraC family L-rhamnose operon regulatory protein RhaS